jgi:signal transduction histidine kinase
VAALARHLNTLLVRVQESMAADRAFVDDASHELRTPISVLRGEVELAQLAAADARADPTRLDAVDESLRAAREETDRLSRLADDLLVLARMDQGQVRLRKQAVDPRQLVEAVVARLGPGRTRIEITGGHSLVNADPARIEQVLTNLVANARRHAFSRVLIGVEDLGAQGVAVTVSDDGKGFPANLLPDAFGRFRRADPARTGRTPSAEGTGLGLAIVAAIVTSHGGDIGATNGPPLGGASVHVRLPAT